MAIISILGIILILVIPHITAGIIICVIRSKSIKSKVLKILIILIILLCACTIGNSKKKERFFKYIEDVINC